VRATLQDGLRWVVARATIALGVCLDWRHRWRMHRFSATQARLRRRYGITADTPLMRHGPDMQAALHRHASQASPSVQLAVTSGSSGAPKEIPYTLARVRGVKAVYIDAFARAYAKLHIGRTSLYVFTSLTSDASLTAMMMAERADLPPYLSTLQAPYRVHHHPEMRAVAARYGAAGVRLWVLALSNPGCIYATNPSTLSVFMDALDGRWETVRQMVVDWTDDPGAFSPMVHRIARRIASIGWRARLGAIAAADRPMGLATIVPALEMFCCWDGGYVRPYLDRVVARLPNEHIRHLPMYSMSTETVETVPHFASEGVGFVPLIPGGLVEFLPVDGPQNADQLICSAELTIGQEVSLVVSDAHGLRRYDTEDVFRVAGRFGGVPDLRFLRRRGLRFSFTGEKLTGEHVRAALDSLAGQYPWLSDVPWAVVVPSNPDGASVPHYRLALGIHKWDAKPDDGGVAADFDRALGQQNDEYAGKRASERLGPIRLECMPLETLVARIGGDRHAETWETQFKFLPLLTRTWEDVFGEAR
jgi:hypothetical protein